MADGMVNHPAGFDQSQKNIYTLHFTSHQWREFWQMMTVGSTMAECLDSLEKKVILDKDIFDFFEELTGKWHRISRELIPVWTSESYDGPRQSH